MSKNLSDAKFWLQDSESYMKNFRQRSLVSFNNKLEKFIDDCLEAHSDSAKLKLWHCFQGSASLCHEISLQLTHSYLNGNWHEYLVFRKLMIVMHDKIFEWISQIDRHEKNEYSFETMSIGMINHSVLPLVLGGNRLDSLPAFIKLLANPIGRSTPFRPDLTETFELMVNHKLNKSVLPVIERFEVEGVYEHLAWRYKYCVKASNGVDFGLALVPDELIAYHLMRESEVEQRLLIDEHFVKIQQALDAIRNEKTRGLAIPKLVEALTQLSIVEKLAYETLEVDVNPWMIELTNPESN